MAIINKKTELRRNSLMKKNSLIIIKKMTFTYLDLFKYKSIRMLTYAAAFITFAI